MRVALTGGTGFVGSHLAEALRTRGDAVVALVRSPAKAGRLDALGCRLVQGDLADERALEELVSGADIVFHVGGLVAARSEADLLRVNRDGTARLVRAARRAATTRLVHVSSLAVTGPSAPGQAVDETTPPRPLTAYGRSKLAGEGAVRESGVPFTIVRPPAVYGPRDRAFLPLFRSAALGLIPLLGDGGQPLTLVHASDLAEALVSVAGTAGTEGRTYHAGHPAPVTQRALAEAVGHAVGRRVRTLTLPGPLARTVLAGAGVAARALGRVPLLDGDKALEILAPGWVCSSEALRRDTGFVARVDLEVGLAETARSYREAGWM